MMFTSLKVWSLCVVWLMSCRRGNIQRSSACVEGLSVNSSSRESIDAGSCECESKNSSAFRWAGVPPDQTWSDYRGKAPNKGTTRPLFTVWARFCLDPHLYFPTASPLTCEPKERLRQPAAHFGNTSPFLNSLRNSRVEIYTLAKQPLAGRGGFWTLRYTFDLF